MSDPATPQIPQIPDNLAADVLIDQYVKLRDRLKKADDEHKKKMDPAKQYLEALNNRLLQTLNTAGGESIKTARGTAYRTEKKSATIKDSVAFRDYVVANELFDMVDWKANATAVEEHIKDFEGTPPGVEFTTVFLVGVRRAGEK